MGHLRIQCDFRDALLQVKAEVLPHDFNLAIAFDGGRLLGEGEIGAQRRHQIVAIDADIVAAIAVKVKAALLIPVISTSTVEPAGISSGKHR